MTSMAERFWSKVDKSGDCWLWTAGRFRGGYGRFKLGGRNVSTHRLSWTIHFGPIPAGLGFHGTCVCHRCDNPRCVKPSHLFLGTHAENMGDMSKKGRAPMGLKRAKAKAVLCEDDIRQMRALRVLYGWSQRRIGRLFGIAYMTARRALSGRTWAEVRP